MMKRVDKYSFDYMREKYQAIHRHVVSKLSSAQKIASGDVLSLPVVSVEELIADLSKTDFFRVLLNPFHSQNLILIKK